MTAGFWVGLAVAVVLVAFPLQRISLMINLLALVGSVVLVAQLVGTVTAPRDPVTIGLPQAVRRPSRRGGARWSTTTGRSPCSVTPSTSSRSSTTGHTAETGAAWTTSRSSPQPVLAVSDARVTEAVDGLPDLPVGGYTRHDMAGNHLVLDIGGGHDVLDGHLQQGSVRVRVGERVRRGQVIGQVGDSGNSGEPHLHLQVQNRPSFDVEDRSIHTFPILFVDATVADVRRGGSAAPALGTLR